MSARCNGSNNATAKRKRGRPPGSKNKPMFPVADCMPHAATLHPHILEIPTGGDVAETIVSFARGCRIFGVCVLSASGPIAAAVLWEASPYPSTRTFQGRFNLLSFTATLLPGGSEGSLAVTLAGPHGQVVSGVVAGPVVAAGTVIVVAATFASSSFHRFGAVNNTSASMLPVVGGEEGCGKSSATEKCEEEKSDRDLRKKCLEELDQFLDSPPEVEGVFIGDSALEEKTGLDGGGEEVDGNMFENYNTSASMLPVVGGEEGCGKSSAAEKCEEEKSDRGMLKKCLEESDQFLNLPPAVEGVFIGDGPSEEKTGLDGGGEEVDGNMFENYLKELEHYLEEPADVDDAFNAVGGRAENRTAGLDGDSGGEGEGDCFDVEQYLDLQRMVDDAFGGSPDGCGEHLDLDAFGVFGACLPLY